jgi:hypothetical protein
MGKSFIWTRVIQELGLSRAFMPMPGQFFMGTFCSSLYDCIVFEEYDHEVFKSNYFQIKTMLDRKVFPIDRKNEPASSLKIKCPIIFCSNFAPHYDHAFVRRVKVIEALENLDHEKVRVPKEVDGSTPVVIDIASTSEDEDEENSFLQAKGIYEEAVASCSKKGILRESNEK